jgi:hypothetical protein
MAIVRAVTFEGVGHDHTVIAHVHANPRPYIAQNLHSERAKNT